MTSRRAALAAGVLAMLLPAAGAFFELEISSGKIIVLAVAAMIGLALLVDPFWPLLLLVLSVPLDALFNRIFDGLPISAGTGLTMLTVAALLIRLPQEPRAIRLLPDDVTVRWAFAFAVVLAISTILAEIPALALVDGGRIGGQLLMLLLIVCIVRTQAQMRFLVFSLVGATLLSALVLLIEAKTGTRLLSRAVGTDFDGIMRPRGASDQNPTTAALMQTFGVTMALLLGLNCAKGRLLGLATGAIGGLGIIYSYARSAALTFALMIILIAWRHRRGRYFPLGVVLAFAGMASVLPLVPDAYWGRLSSLANFDTDRTLWRRVGYNLIGLDLVAKYPLFGVGVGNFPHFYMDPEYRYLPGRTLEPRLLHNMYLAVCAEMGLTGLLVFVGMISSAMTRLYGAMKRSVDPESRAIALALLYGSAAYYFGSLVTPAQYVKFTWVLIGLAVVQTRLMAQAEAAATTSLSALTAPEKLPAGSP